MEEIATNHNYALFAMEKRKWIKICINCSSETRVVESWKTEE